MSRSTYYIQECPTCGRSLHVRVEYLGRMVVCQHCHAQFEACDPASTAYPPSQSGISIFRAEELIESASNSKLGMTAGSRPPEPRSLERKACAERKALDVLSGFGSVNCNRDRYAHAWLVRRRHCGSFWIASLYAQPRIPVRRLSNR